MARSRRIEEVRSISEFRANAAQLVRRIQKRGAAIVLTQRGRRAAVVMGNDAYDKLIEELELLRDIRQSETEIASGRTLSTAAVKRQILSRLAR